jgi:hypothetical protein
MPASAESCTWRLVMLSRILPLGAGHGAERHGHFLAAPPVPFLGKRMGH